MTVFSVLYPNPCYDEGLHVYSGEIIWWVFQPTLKQIVTAQVLEVWL